MAKSAPYGSGFNLGRVFIGNGHRANDRIGTRMAGAHSHRFTRDGSGAHLSTANMDISDCLFGVGWNINGVREQSLYLSNRKTKKVLVDLIPPETNVTFIDLGCGLGRYSDASVARSTRLHHQE